MADADEDDEDGAPRRAAREHFEAKFAQQADPWHYRTSWYETRKRALMLAALPRERYRRGFEPGCANGELSACLAPRCELLRCADFAPSAAALSRARLAGFAQAGVELRTMPEDWPEGRFDLIVISEFAYYLDASRCAQLARLACAALDADGTLACCHWRHGAEDMMLSAAAVHALFAQAARQAGLHARTRVDDADFLLEVWSAEAPPAARR